MNREYLKDGIRLMKGVEAKQLPFNMDMSTLARIVQSRHQT